MHTPRLKHAALPSLILLALVYQIGAVQAQAAPTRLLVTATAHSSMATGTATLFAFQMLGSTDPQSRCTPLLLDGRRGNPVEQSGASVYGLTLGVPYACEVRFTKNGIDYLGQAPVTLVPPETAPARPNDGVITALYAIPGAGSITLHFTSPAAAIGSYLATCIDASSPIPKRYEAASGTASPLTVTGLVPGAPQQCFVQPYNSAGLGNGYPIVRTAIATLPLPGQRNGMATVAIAHPTDCVPVGLQLSTATLADSLPGNATAPLGLLRFRAMHSSCIGATLGVRVDYPTDSLNGLTAHKFGLPAAGDTPGWFRHGRAVGDSVTYIVTDNATGDNDSAPGAIADPFAPLLLAAPPSPGDVQAVPTLSQWGMFLLSALAALFGTANYPNSGIPKNRQCRQTRYF